jgi:hypothetical protein
LYLTVCIMRDRYTLENEVPDELNRLGLAEVRDRIFVRYLYLREGPELFWRRVAEAVARNDERFLQVREVRGGLLLEWIALEPWTGNKRPNLGRIADALLRQWRRGRLSEPAGQVRTGRA